MYKNLKYLFISSLVFMACSEEVTEEGSIEEPLTAGSANFSKYVALGNSLTAGFSDGALFIKGQENAYANIMAAEFTKVGGGDFKTPFMADNLGGFQAGGAQVPGLPTRLFFNGSAPQNVPGLSATVLGQSIAGDGPYQNMGIPGAKSFHLGFSGYGTLNPYYGRIATSAAANVIADAVGQNPTFFSLWIGNNDVLSFATSGGVGVNQLGNPNPATYGGNDITDPTAFAGIYNQMITALTANGAKGIVANIPSVTSVPYFTTVPHNPVPLDAATAAALNNGYLAYNNGLLFAQANNLLSAAEVARRTISFTASNSNAVVMIDSYLTDLSGFGIPSFRQATAEDLIVLPARSFIGTLVGGNPAQVNGLSVPLADNWVLCKEEIAEVAAATTAFNNAIKAAADSKGLAFVDANAIMNRISTTGYQHGGFNFTGAYVFGNTFSLDGVHLSPRANGFVANKMLEAINATYGSNFKPVSLTRLPALYGLNL